MEILTNAVIFFISLAVVVKSADYFTISAERIGLWLGLSPFIIGAIILSIGTSLPELVTSIAAVLKHHSEIVIADVAGSNITNILLVLGVTFIFAKKNYIEYDALLIDYPVLLFTTLFIYFAFLGNRFGLIEGFFSLISLTVYITYALKVKKEVDIENTTPTIKDPLILIASIVLLNFGAKYTIINVIKLSQLLHIATGIIAATVIALGTSLPELVVSATAARKGKMEIAVGNVVGSNIFNALGVLGFSSLFGQLNIDQPTKTYAIPFLVAATILLGFILKNRNSSRWIGFILVIFYGFFVYKLFF
ncbi:calcium/sodium antiporter [Hippea jasoniae]|uniref:calcium/sodium antiporter n=1 Tax=Hippea jasoniae TaxID=944479 RepID=UPI000A072B33|nr:calcium/sodium antiporter [Hippea jasoniae]